MNLIPLLVVLGLTSVSETPDVGRISNWQAPLMWTPARGARIEPTTTASAPLPFIALTPCRIVDTRGTPGVPINTGGKFSADEIRTWTLTGLCGLPTSSAAVSLNITVTATDESLFGYVSVWPGGTTEPNVSTLNWSAANVTESNAAVVPLGTGGSAGQVSLRSVNAGAHVIVDVNGYYDGNGVITGVTAGTGLTGGGTSGTVSLGIAAAGVTSTELASDSVTSSKIAANAVTAGAIAPGQVVKSANGFTDAVTIAGSGLVTVGTSGSTITVGAPAGPSGTFLLGFPYDTTLIGAGYTDLGPSNQDAWKPMSTVGAPVARGGYTAVWTGSKMIVWGGANNSVDNHPRSGGQYDPIADSWTATTTTNAPAGRTDHTAVWTDSKMIVWGGANFSTDFNTGGIYDPVGNSWAATSLAGAPLARRRHTAVWTGSLMVVWGGFNLSTGTLNTGARFDPVANSWAVTTTASAPSDRYKHSAVWTGSRMIVWGGANSSGDLVTGGSYDPGGDSWVPIATAGAPPGRVDQTAVWTGSRMIIWGGSGSVYVNTGGRYDPVGDTWTSTSTIGAPSGRSLHTAVWTGSKMIIWGGFDGTSSLKTGGKYDPAADSWSPTSLAGVPEGIGGPGIWTGTKMVVWGGGTNAGGQYATLSLYLKN